MANGFISSLSISVFDHLFLSVRKIDSDNLELSCASPMVNGRLIVKYRKYFDK